MGGNMSAPLSRPKFVIEFGLNLPKNVFKGGEGANPGGKLKIIRGLLQSRDYWEMHRMTKYICLLVESFWCKSGKSKIMVGVSHSLLPIQWMTRIPHRAPQDPEDFVPEWHNPGFVVIWLTQHRICYLKKNTGYVNSLLSLIIQLQSGVWKLLYFCCFCLPL